MYDAETQLLSAVSGRATFHRNWTKFQTVRTYVHVLPPLTGVQSDSGRAARNTFGAVQQAQKRFDKTGGGQRTGKIKIDTAVLMASVVHTVIIPYELTWLLVSLHLALRCQ